LRDGRILVRCCRGFVGASAVVLEVGAGAGCTAEPGVCDGSGIEEVEEAAEAADGRLTMAEVERMAIGRLRLSSASS
jgi:hypothetical protein